MGYGNLIPVLCNRSMWVFFLITDLSSGPIYNILTECISSKYYTSYITIEQYFKVIYYLHYIWYYTHTHIHTFIYTYDAISTQDEKETVMEAWKPNSHPGSFLHTQLQHLLYLPAGWCSEGQVFRGSRYLAQTVSWVTQGQLLCSVWSNKRLTTRGLSCHN